MVIKMKRLSWLGFDREQVKGTKGEAWIKGMEKFFGTKVKQVKVGMVTG